MVPFQQDLTGLTKNHDKDENLTTSINNLDEEISQYYIFIE